MTHPSDRHRLLWPRNLALVTALMALVVVFFLVTLVRFGEG